MVLRQKNPFNTFKLIRVEFGLTDCSGLQRPYVLGSLTNCSCLQRPGLLRGYVCVYWDWAWEACWALERLDEAGQPHFLLEGLPCLEEEASTIVCLLQTTSGNGGNLPEGNISDRWGCMADSRYCFSPQRERCCKSDSKYSAVPVVRLLLEWLENNSRLMRVQFN